jgi:hypothetical protein
MHIKPQEPGRPLIPQALLNDQVACEKMKSFRIGEPAYSGFNITQLKNISSTIVDLDFGKTDFKK